MTFYLSLTSTDQKMNKLRLVYSYKSSTGRIYLSLQCTCKSSKNSFCTSLIGMIITGYIYPQAKHQKHLCIHEYIILLYETCIYYYVNVHLLVFVYWQA